MRRDHTTSRLRILGLALLALFVLGALMAGMASAEEGVLPPSNFTIKGGKQTLGNLAEEEIACGEVTGSGKFLTEKETDQHATGTLDFSNCAFAGFSFNTLGDASGVVLTKVLYLVCLTEPKTLLFGLLILFLENPVHIEVPSLKELLLTKGYVIGTLVQAGELEGTAFLVSFNETDKAKGKCTINGTEFKSTYEEAFDTKADIDAFRKGEATVTFAEKLKFMDT